MTKEAARRWLNKTTEKRGGSFWFTPAEQRKLNKYVEKFGNTFFW